MSQDARLAHGELIARRKLNKILRTNAIKETAVRVGDMVQVFIRTDNEKRGNRLLPETVLSYGIACRTLTVSGARGPSKK